MSRNPKNVPAKSKSPLPFIIIGVVLVGVTAAVVLLSRSSTTSSNSTSTAPASTNSTMQATQPRMATQPGAPSPFTRGSQTARVTVEEFSDFQCPACSVLEPGLRRVMKDYEDRVHFIFRNYPLQMHKYAFLASRAAEAAGLQGKFWEMHDMLYDNQKEWSDSMEPRVQFDSYATRLGLDVQRFKQDMERQDVAERVKADLLRGNSLGVKGTPTVYLNGRELVPGKLVTEEDLRREIEAALAQGK